MEENRKLKIREIKNIEEMIDALRGGETYQIIDMIKCEINELKKELKYEKNIAKAELLLVKMELLKKGIVVYSDYYCEECRYLINYIRRGECTV